LTETKHNSVLLADNITEVREAPDIEVTDDKVFSAALENIDSRTKATQNATITQTNTSTEAGGNLGIRYQAAWTLAHTETNVMNHAREDPTITRKANIVNYVVDGQQVQPEATTNDNGQGRM